MFSPSHSKEICVYGCYILGGPSTLLTVWLIRREILGKSFMPMPIVVREAGDSMSVINIREKGKQLIRNNVVSIANVELATLIPSREVKWGDDSKFSVYSRRKQSHKSKTPFADRTLSLSLSLSLTHGQFANPKLGTTQNSFPTSHTNDLDFPIVSIRELKLASNISFQS